jgi:plastocyanin
MGRCKRLVAIGAAVGLIVVLAGCGAGEEASGDVHKGAAGAGAVRVVMQDDRFQPAVLRVPAGSPVTLEVRNDGQKNHNLTIAGLDVSTGPMHHGDVTTVRLTAPKGTTQFRCTWHQGMVGQIVTT